MDAHEGLSVLRFAAGSPRNGLLWGTVFRFCVCRSVCVGVRVGVRACVRVCAVLLFFFFLNISAVFSLLAIRCFYDYVRPV